MYLILCRSYIDPDGPRKETDPIEEWKTLSVLFYGSRSLKLLVSITTNQLASSILIARENDSLGRHEPENETDNFDHCLLGCTMLNWIIMDEVVGLFLWSYSS